LIRAIVLALGLAIAAPALAADGPEAVYAKYHRAGLAGDYDAMLKYGTAANLPSAERKRLLRVLARLLPRSYSVVEETIEEGGKRALLRLRGAQPQAVLGTITLVKERGEWKVDEANWAER
jgi:hypothetical protein